MKVLLDRTLKAAGLDYRTAVALLAPGQDELVIYVHQLLDGPPIPKPEPDEPEPQPEPAAFSLRVIAPDTKAPMAPPEPLDVYTPGGPARLMKPGGAGGVGGGAVKPQAVPPMPQNAGKGYVYPVDVHAPVEGERAISSLAIQSRSTDCDSAARVNGTSRAGPVHPDLADQDLAGQADVAGRRPANDGPLVPTYLRPHRLPERGFTWADVEQTAKALRMTATLGAGNGVILSDAFGSTAYPSVSAVIPVLNARLAYLGAIGTRWPNPELQP